PHSAAALWTAEGIPLSNGSAGKLASDGQGGIFLLYNSGSPIYAKRFDSSGSLVAGWPSGGLLVESYDPAYVGGSVLDAVADGSGDAIAMIAWFTPGGSYPTHLRQITGAATRGPAWDSVGLC